MDAPVGTGQTCSNRRLSQKWHVSARTLDRVRILFPVQRKRKNADITGIVTGADLVRIWCGMNRPAELCQGNVEDVALSVFSAIESDFGSGIATD